MFTEVDYKILELVLQSPEPVPSRAAGTGV